MWKISDNFGVVSENKSRGKHSLVSTLITALETIYLKYFR